MSVVLGIDLGTTTITALTLNTESGDLLARVTAANRADVTSSAERARGRSEWDLRLIAETACGCLREAADQMGASWARLAGVGITGQQHGMALVDGLQPLTPLIGWEDRRAEESYPGTDRTYVQEAIRRFGAEAPRRTGCRLAAGYMAATLFWMKTKGLLPSSGTACFVPDYFGSFLTGRPLVTDPTCAASSGVFNVSTGEWDADLILALELPRPFFPEVRLSGSVLGEVTPALAEATGLPAGLPVFVGIGDNQASFLGSVNDPGSSVLVNVGTGGQVAAFVETFLTDPLLETRPFPGGGYLLVEAGLCGGRSYALLEHFFRQVGMEVCGGVPAEGPLFEAMNRLAGTVPPGADGLRCEPFFTGSRSDPGLRASWTGLSASNLTPAHLTRALLEGMARTFHAGYERIARLAGCSRSQLVGAGNGLRENLLLRQLVATEFGMPMVVPWHREEAAFGAALVGSIGAGVHPGWEDAGWLMRYSKVDPLDLPVQAGPG